MAGAGGWGCPPNLASPFFSPGAYQSTFKSASAPTPLPDKFDFSRTLFSPHLREGECLSCLPEGFFLPKCPLTSLPRASLGPALSKDLWDRQIFPQLRVMTMSKVDQGLCITATAHNRQGAHGPRSYGLASLVHLIFFFF